MTDEDYYGPERADEKARAAEWFFACALVVLAILLTLGMMSLEATP